MIRTQEEIKERFNQADDLFGQQQEDLILYMDWETAKEYLDDKYIEGITSGNIVWESPLATVKRTILDYLPFAYNKAENQRGLSAHRSLLHFKTWIWLDDPEFYTAVLATLEAADDYGIPALDMIAKHYGYES